MGLQVKIYLSPVQFFQTCANLEISWSFPPPAYSRANINTVFHCSSRVIDLIRHMASVKAWSSEQALKKVFPLWSGGCSCFSWCWIKSRCICTEALVKFVYLLESLWNKISLVKWEWNFSWKSSRLSLCVSWDFSWQGWMVLCWILGSVFWGSLFMEIPQIFTIENLKIFPIVFLFKNYYFLNNKNRTQPKDY